MTHVRTKDATMHIDGPDDSGHYWLHLSASGEACKIDLGRPTKMVETALLMAASVRFGRPSGDYTLAPHLQKIVDGAKTAPQWDTQADRIAAIPATDAREAAQVIAKNGAEATAAAMILHIAKTLRTKGKAVLTTGDDFGAQVLQFADAIAALEGKSDPKP